MNTRTIDMTLLNESALKLKLKTIVKVKDGNNDGSSDYSMQSYEMLHRMDVLVTVFMNGNLKETTMPIVLDGYEHKQIVSILEFRGDLGYTKIIDDTLEYNTTIRAYWNLFPTLEPQE